MILSEKLKSQAEEFRIYAKAECLPARADQWNQWAENCEEAATQLEEGRRQLNSALDELQHLSTQ